MARLCALFTKTDGSKKGRPAEDLPSFSAEAAESDVKSQLHEPSPILQYWENILCLLTTACPSAQETKGRALLFPASLHVGVGVGMTHAPITAQAPQILLFPGDLGHLVKRSPQGRRRLFDLTFHHLPCPFFPNTSSNRKFTNLAAWLHILGWLGDFFFFLMSQEDFFLVMDRNISMQFFSF